MIKGIILDLDGTVYLGAEQIPGAAEFVAGLKEHNIRHLFVTNRANRVPEQICAHLQGYGIICTPDDILTSAQAAVRHLEKGSVYFIGEEGMEQAVREQGMIVDEESPDYVIVSYDRTFNYDKLKKACSMIDKGAQFIATNPDCGLRTENGISPGTGAIVAAVEAGCGQKPFIIGKPEKLIMDMALAKMDMTPQEVIAVGDNLATDILAGERAGIRTLLMLTGISTREDLDNSEIKPTWTAETYDQVKTVLSSL
jgi:4-nitrophenyl phosphatase